MSKKLPMMVLISSPRMRRGEAGDLEEMFDCGLERLHLRKPDHSAKDVSKILDKIPEKYLGRIVLHRVPELLKDYPVAGYHHSSKERARSTNAFRFTPKRPSADKAEQTAKPATPKSSIKSKSASPSPPIR